MARKSYKIVIGFTYKDGTTDGLLVAAVNSRKAIKVQLKAGQEWLAHKGHSINTIAIAEVVD